MRNINKNDLKRQDAKALDRGFGVITGIKAKAAGDLAPTFTVKAFGTERKNGKRKLKGKGKEVSEKVYADEVAERYYNNMKDAGEVIIRL